MSNWSKFSKFMGFRDLMKTGSMLSHQMSYAPASFLLKKSKFLRSGLISAVESGDEMAIGMANNWSRYETGFFKQGLKYHSKAFLGVGKVNPLSGWQRAARYSMIGGAMGSVGYGGYRAMRGRRDR